MREKVGRAIHERFLEEQKDRRPADVREVKPWHELDEDLKESNRQQADDIPNKLDAIGCVFEPLRPGEELRPFRFADDELNIMARLEHERWNKERLRAGWRLGPTRDNQARTTPYLVPFDELSPEVQKLDVEAVMSIPDILKRAGFQIYRLRRE
jgi:hypothetical protein